MPAATHGWLTAGTESRLNYRGCFCRHKSQTLARAPTLQQAGIVDLISQSITHPPPPRLAALTAKQNDFWSCWMLSAFAICLLVAEAKRFIFSHYLIVALLTDVCHVAHAAFPKKWISSSHFVIVLPDVDIWSWGRSYSKSPQDAHAWAALCDRNRNGTGLTKADKFTGVWRN